MQRVLADGVLPHVIKGFQQQRTVSVTEAKHSYATYMLMSVAMIFDVEDTAILREIESSALLKSRLSFLCDRLSSKQMSVVQGSVEAYFDQRL
jgi:hypothetical protein